MKYTFITRPLDLKNLTEEEFVELVRRDMNTFFYIFPDQEAFIFEIDYDYGPKDINLHVQLDNSDDKLQRCLKSLSKSKNFEKAIGWKLEYEQNPKTGKINFAPSFNIYFEENYQKEVIKNSEKQAKEISEFYNSLDYKGD